MSVGGATITSLGVGSGIDLNDITRQLVDAERKNPEERLDRREAQLEAQLSAFGKLKGAMSGLESALTNLRRQDTSVTGTSSDPTRLGVSVFSSVLANQGRYTVEINQLAKAQSLATPAGMFDNVNSVVGRGQLTIQVGSADAVNITIDETNDTLAGVRDAINASNAGVRASLVNDANGARLVLSSQSTGASNTISITVTDDDGDNSDANGLSRLAYDSTTATGNMIQVQPAQNALVTVNGLALESATNTLSGNIPGMTLDLRAPTEPNSPIIVDVGQDRETVRKAVDSFVEAYNGLITIAREFTAFNPQTGDAAVLLGDTTLRGIRSRLSQDLGRSFSIAGSNFSSLVGLGITSDREGKLTVNESRLNEALESDQKGALAVLSQAATVMRDGVRTFSDRGALLDSRTEGVQKRLRDVAVQRERLEDRLGRLEVRLRREFGAMDSLVGQLQSTGNFLEQQLGMLNSMLSNNRKR